MNTVTLPRRDAEELRRLVDRAITLADKREQAGEPLPANQYQRLMHLYGALDRALSPQPSKPIHQIGVQTR